MSVTPAEGPVDWQIRDAHWPAILASHGAPGSVRDLVSKNNVEGDGGCLSPDGSLWLLCARAHWH